VQNLERLPRSMVMHLHEKIKEHHALHNKKKKERTTQSGDFGILLSRFLSQKFRENEFFTI